MIIYYSHSIVPGGLDVKSYKTREIPGSADIFVAIFFTNCERENGIHYCH